MQKFRPSLAAAAVALVVASGSASAQVSNFYFWRQQYGCRRFRRPIYREPGIGVGTGGRSALRRHGDDVGRRRNRLRARWCAGRSRRAIRRHRR